jgi:ribonucleoside-diphosphate reductase alpha chain
LSKFSISAREGTKIKQGKSCASAIGNILKDILKEFKDEDIEDKSKIKTEKNKNVTNTLSKDEKKYIKDNGEVVFAKRFNKCPECGETLRQEGGCITCPSCGWSKCD